MAALYANDSNPPVHGGASGAPTHGFIDDLSRYHMGSGHGWAAVDPTTGDALLLSVTGRAVGTAGCGYYGQYCSGTRLGQLGELSGRWLASGISSNVSQSYDLIALLPDDLMDVVYGCQTSYNYLAVPLDTCTGRHLVVSVTPVGVVRGDVLGLRPSDPSGVSDSKRPWSPGGSYNLYLTGLSIFD
ncbi:hypothetical protein EWD33_24320 [Salmonella enterica subsp. enterica serovar Oranienburg]|nr:hypothetical protein [Salmonella enterica subsp. enterica serovar Oranienburg]